MWKSVCGGCEKEDEHWMGLAEVLTDHTSISCVTELGSSPFSLSVAIARKRLLCGTLRRSGRRWVGRVVGGRRRGLLGVRGRYIGGRRIWRACRRRQRWLRRRRRRLDGHCAGARGVGASVPIGRRLFRRRRPRGHRHPSTARRRVHRPERAPVGGLSVGPHRDRRGHRLSHHPIMSHHPIRASKELRTKQFG